MYKKHDGNQASIESALKTNGMNEESAKIIAEKIKNKKFDL